ncbi:hypothetical protein PYW08_015514 [Mythimna loreyi]|uniref:Uncharacterized protein n=1 Tax=Mythimna loreyi TaxID=667449 RepID=A0ACC2QW63_9NEOP|nr:hypothetical protein PYW08_015514 [Mythimna loreyi]
MEKKYVYVIILFFGFCHGRSKDTGCTTQGKFLNDESADCRGYTMCLLSGLTNFTQYKFMCPIGFVYNHLEEKCTKATNYKCIPNFKCTSVGNFAVPKITDCSSYIACIEGLGKISTARLVGCPSNTFFNSTAGICVNDTVFSCKTFKLNQDVIAIDPPTGGVDVPDETTSSRGAATYISLAMVYFIILLLSVLK